MLDSEETMSSDLTDLRRSFPALNTYTWLNTAGSGPGASPVIWALSDALDQWRRGEFDTHDWYEDAQKARGLFARLIGATAREIALLPTAAAGVATIAGTIARLGHGKIIVGEREFRSNLFPWLDLSERGFEVIEVATNSDNVTTTEALIAAIDEGTTLVAVSDVQFAHGYRVDLRRVAQRAREVGARLFVDATQSLGVIRFDLEGVQPDYLVAHGYKWMLCPRGAAWLYISQRTHQTLADIVPLAPSWASVSGDPYIKMDGGPYLESLSVDARRADFSPAWLSWVGARAALNLLLSLNPAELEEHCFGLADVFRNSARKQNISLAPAEQRSHIVGVDMGTKEAAQAASDKLKSKKIITGVRGNYLRIGFHGFNTENEVNRTLTSIREL
jgi:selenocysteine lyase/cysteine desulfurase